MYASKAVRRLELETKTLTVVVKNNILKTPWPKNRINPLVSTKTFELRVRTRKKPTQGSCRETN